jgi:hypothetical protein
MHYRMKISKQSNGLDSLRSIDLAYFHLAFEPNLVGQTEKQKVSASISFKESFVDDEIGWVRSWRMQHRTKKKSRFLECYLDIVIA